jgi:predicted sugar kinase
MSEYHVDQSTAMPASTWSKTIILTYNQDGEPKRIKVKCQLIDPSIISSHTVSVLAMAPAVEAICGKWGDPTPNIRVVHAERKYSFGLSSLYFGGFVVSLGVAFCFILMKYHNAS